MQTTTKTRPTRNGNHPREPLHRTQHGQGNHPPYRKVRWGSVPAPAVLNHPQSRQQSRQQPRHHPPRIRTLVAPTMPIQRPCLVCRRLTTNIQRCELCQAAWQANRNKKRIHYQGDYASRAKRVRDTTLLCWLCGKGSNPDDPWQADHVTPGDPNSELRGAHRSCNASRGNRGKA
jgi:hypothetical protein